jgi:hypothetical protein
LDYIFELLLDAFKQQERKVPVILEGIQRYIVEIISVFDYQVLISNQEKVKPLMDLF